jgi:hypothetical protein
MISFLSTMARIVMPIRFAVLVVLPVVGSGRLSDYPFAVVSPLELVDINESDLRWHGTSAYAFNGVRECSISAIW